MADIETGWKMTAGAQAALRVRVTVTPSGHLREWTLNHQSATGTRCVCRCPPLEVTLP